MVLGFIERELQTRPAVAQHTEYGAGLDRKS